jgi:ribonucleoside-diphosphate reductase alpha chain
MARAAPRAAPRRRRADAPAPADPAALAVLRAAVAAPGESSWDAVAERVARCVAEVEPKRQRSALEERFLAAIRSRRFVPSVPILSNAGRSDQLAACFVLAPEDRLDDIYATLAQAALIQQLSGGVGVELSALRPHGARIRRAGGRSPGPLAFAELFAHSARINALSGRRPGAHLAILADDHPDVLEFVRAAGSGETRYASLGFAVAVSDRLLAAARRGDWHALRHPRLPETRRVRARALLAEIARAIAATGQPTLLFADAIEAANPTPELGRLRATNPCGEQPLLPGESCVLGSLQLPAFADAHGALDLAALESAAGEAVRFLDDVVERCAFPGEACARASRRTRKVGLGVMGLADLLLLRGLRYDAPAARRLTGEILACVRRGAERASRKLAAERGAFPAFRGRGPRRRNATLLAVAPTGTIRLLAGCNGGVEPFLQPVVQIETAETRLRWTDPWLRGWLEARAAAPAAVLDALEGGVAAARLPGLAPRERALLRAGGEVDWRAQIEIQAAAQAHVDGAVSKTIQLPANATPASVLAGIRLARSRGCKGFAAYRATHAAVCLDCRGLA